MSKKSKKPALTNLLLGVTGGIAAYKSADLVRRLKEHSFDVRVVMTESAKNFITPMTMQAVSGNPVHHQLFDCQAEAAMGHIELAKWADIILVAPATANSLSKIALGLADDLLTTLILASRAQLIVAPAMNQQMWANQAIVDNVEILIRRKVQFIGPEQGDQACGDIGFGRMTEPLQIVEQVLQLGMEAAPSIVNDGLKETAKSLAGKNVLITAGPTLEAIDPVRYISNHSSGKMGYALAKAASNAGAKVTLVSGPVSLCAPLGVALESVVSATEMLNCVKARMDRCDIFIGCAAVADYAPLEVANQKIKKNDEQMQISLKKNPDILAWVAAQTNRPYVVGFAAESQNMKEFAKKKLLNKKLDLICANDISQTDMGFNSENNEILILGKNNLEIKLPAASKTDIAADIVTEISKQLNSYSN